MSSTWQPLKALQKSVFSVLTHKCRELQWEAQGAFLAEAMKQSSKCGPDASICTRAVHCYHISIHVSFLFYPTFHFFSRSHFCEAWHWVMVFKACINHITMDMKNTQTRTCSVCFFFHFCLPFAFWELWHSHVQGLHFQGLTIAKKLGFCMKMPCHVVN